jgi:agmatine deiminase
VAAKRRPTPPGWRLPAEWEPHEATWIGWPHNTTDWPGRFGPIPWAYAEMARWITRGETLRILVESGEHRARAERTLARFGVDRARLEFFRIPTDRGWTRDSGPTFVGRGGPDSGEVAIRRFRFNGWARYPDWKRDVRVPERVGKALGIPVLPAGPLGREVVLEGGAIDVNGRGTLVTTEECLLDPEVQVRNPGFGRADYERVFAESLGASNVLWLGRGIAGDDTHGHVDDLARFVDAGTLVICREEDPSDENHVPLEENRERAQDFRLEDGSRPEVVALPMPSPVVFDGRRLPASYANFYVANAAVLVPTFNDERDREALGILGELFADRPVVGIYAGDLVWGLGTIHCLTRQQPA